jgi:DNA topoisomerase-2
LYGSIKRNLTKTEIKVAQLAGYISENAAYHHGEASLQGTIVNMAQDYVGSNNIELLEPIGQFGTRIMGGKDSAQPRYIYTKLSQITSLLFNKKDDALYKPQFDEGMRIEPNNYVPVLPMVLINGCQGIGTGWSTDVPLYNPFDIISNINNYMNDTEMNDMNPYYRGFTGTITKESKHTYISKGIYTIKDNKLIITELPIGVWSDKYKEFLETLCLDGKNKSKKQIIRYYNSYCTDTQINFELFMDKDTLVKLNSDTIYKLFKLTSSINTSNMVLYNSNNTITKYDNVLDILREFCDIRLELYEVRKTYMIDELQREIDLMAIKIRFINEFIEEKITIIRVKKVDIIEQLKSKGYPEIEGYDYLLKMPIYNLTFEKIDEFEKKLANLNEELELIKSKSKQDLWREDIDMIRNELKNYGYNKLQTKKLKVKLQKGKVK